MLQPIALLKGTIWICIVVAFKWERLIPSVSKCEQLSPLFICPSHICCSRCPVWISLNVNLLSLSIRTHLNVRATRAALPCLFLSALPEWTSTGYGNIGSLIWIIRKSTWDIFAPGAYKWVLLTLQGTASASRQLFAPPRRACSHMPTLHTAAYTPYSDADMIYITDMIYIADLIYIAIVFYPTYFASWSERHISWTSLVDIILSFKMHLKIVWLSVCIFLYFYVCVCLCVCALIYICVWFISVFCLLLSLNINTVRLLINDH